MHIVIDIPEGIYKDIMAHNREMREGGKSAYYFEGLIQNGTPLPKESDIDTDYITGYNCGYSDAIYDMSERSEEDADSN